MQAIQTRLQARHEQHLGQQHLAALTQARDQRVVVTGCRSERVDLGAREPVEGAGLHDADAGPEQRLHLAGDVRARRLADRDRADRPHASRPASGGTGGSSARYWPKPGFCSSSPCGLSSTWPRTSVVHARPRTVQPS